MNDVYFNDEYNINQKINFYFPVYKIYNNEKILIGQINVIINVATFNGNISININFRDIFSRIYYIENGIDHIIPSVIPIKKNNISSLDQDFLLLSYNEGNTIFKQKDCYPIICKVIKESPSFIVVCTQESSSSTVSHYQHILKDALENLNYTLLFKGDGTIINGSGKNVRSRIYYNNYTVMKKVLNNNNNNNNNYKFYTNNIKYGTKYLIELESNNVKRYGITSGKFYKGVILLNFIITDTKFNKYKFTIINTHLYYNKKGNSGLSERRKDFMDIITTYDLAKKYKDGYNIFLCGDLNFRLLHFSNTNTKTNFQSQSEKIIFNYLMNQSKFKQNFTINHKNNNELYKLLNEFSKKTQYSSLLNEFLKNYILIGLHLTAKYIEDKGDIDEKFYKKRNINKMKLKQNISQVFNIFPKKDISKFMKLFTTKTKYPPYPRVPSSTDKILFALSDIKIQNANYFDVFIYPNKSDHKMITLSFKI